MEVEINKTTEEIAKEYAQKRADIEMQQRQAEIDGIEIREIDYLLDESNSQLFILKGLLESELYFNAVIPYLNKNVFENERNLESIYNSIVAYHNKYKKQPNYGDIQADANHLFDSVISLQILEEIQKLPTPSYDAGSIIYDVTRSAIFYENMRVESARYLSSDGEYSGKYKPKNLTFQEWRNLCDGKILDKIQKMSEITFESNQGVSLMESNLDTFKDEMKPKISTGIQSLDFLLGGGYVDKSLNIVMASTGGGKTSFMINLALNAVKAGYRVLYLSLEITEIDILQRMYGHIAGVHPMRLKSINSEIFSQKKAKFFGGLGGDIVVKDYPAGTLKASNILSKLKLEAAAGFYYDMVIVDYLGLMDSDKNFSKDSMYSKLKSISEELHSLSKIAPARDREGLPIITGVQSTREAMNKDYKDEGTLDLNDISESIGIAQTADTIIGLAKISNKSYNKVKSFDLIEWIENNPSNIDNEKRNFISCRIMKNRNAGILNSLIFEARFDTVTFNDIHYNLKTIGCSDEFQKDYKIERKNAHLKAVKIRKDLNEERFKKIQEINAELFDELDSSDAVIKEEVYTIKNNGENDVEGNIVVIEPMIKHMSKDKKVENEIKTDDSFQFEIPNIEQNEVIDDEEEFIQPDIKNSQIEITIEENESQSNQSEEYDLEPIKVEDFMAECNAQKIKKGKNVLDLSKFDGNGIANDTISLNESVENVNLQTYESAIAELYPNVSTPPSYDPTEPINYYTDLFKLSKNEVPNITEILPRVQIDAVTDIRNIYNLLPSMDCSENEYKTWQIDMIKMFKNSYGNISIDNQNKCKFDYESMIERYHKAKENLKETIEFDVENRMSDIQAAIVSFYEKLEEQIKKKVVKVEESPNSKQSIFFNIDKKIELMIDSTLSIENNSKITGKSSKKVLKFIEEEIELNDLVNGNSKKYESVPLALGFGKYVSKDVLIQCLTNHNFNVFYNQSMFMILRILWVFENYPLIPTDTYYYYRDVFFKVKLKLSLGDEKSLENDYVTKTNEFLKIMFEWAISGDYSEMFVKGFVKTQNAGMILTKKGAMFNIFQFITGNNDKLSKLNHPINIINMMVERFKNDTKFAEKLFIFESSEVTIGEYNDDMETIKGGELFPHKLLAKAIEKSNGIVLGDYKDVDIFMRDEYSKIRNCLLFKVPKNFKNSKDEFIKEKKNQIQLMEENFGRFNVFNSDITTMLETIMNVQNGNQIMNTKTKQSLEVTPQQLSPSKKLIDSKAKIRNLINSNNETPSMVVDNVNFGTKEETLSFTRYQILNGKNIDTWIKKFQQKYEDKIPKWAKASIIAAFWNFLGYEQIGRNKFIKISESSVYVDSQSFQRCLVNPSDDIKGEMIEDDIVIISELVENLKNVENLQDIDFKDNLKLKFPLLMKRLEVLKELPLIDIDLLNENLPCVDMKGKIEGMDVEKTIDNINKIEIIQNVENDIAGMAVDTIKQALVESRDLFPELEHLTNKLSNGDEVSIDEIHQAIKSEALSLSKNITDEQIQYNINYWKQKGKLKGDLKYYQIILEYLNNLMETSQDNRPITSVVQAEINKMMFEIDFKSKIPEPNVENFKNDVIETHQAINGDDELDIIIKEKSKFQKGFLAYFQRNKDFCGLTNQEQALEIERKQSTIEEKHNLLIQKLEEMNASEEVKLWVLNRMMSMQSVGDDSDIVIPEYILNPKNDKSTIRKHHSFLNVPVECELMLGDLKRKHIETFLQSRFVSYDTNANDSELEMLAISEWLKIPSSSSKHILSLDENKRKMALYNTLFSISNDDTINNLKNELDEINSLKNPTSSNIFKRQIIDVYEKHFQDNGICLDLADSFLSENKLPTKYEYYTLNSYWELKTTMFREFLTEMKIVCNPEFYPEFNTYKQFRNFKLNLIDIQNKKELLDDISIKKANIIKGYYALENLERLWMFDNEVAFCKNKWLLPALYRDVENCSGYNDKGDVLTRQNKTLKEMTKEELLEYDEEVYDELRRIAKYTKEAHLIINKMKSFIAQGKSEQAELLANINKG